MKLIVSHHYVLSCRRALPSWYQHHDLVFSNELIGYLHQNHLFFGGCHHQLHQLQHHHWLLLSSTSNSCMAVCGFEALAGIILPLWLLWTYTLSMSWFIFTINISISRSTIMVASTTTIIIIFVIAGTLLAQCSTPEWYLHYHLVDITVVVDFHIIIYGHLWLYGLHCFYGFHWYVHQHYQCHDLASTLRSAAP